MNPQPDGDPTAPTTKSRIHPRPDDPNGQDRMNPQPNDDLTAPTIKSGNHPRPDHPNGRDRVDPDRASIPRPPLDARTGLREYAERLGDVPAYVYDLPGLDAHAEAIRRALPGIEIYYAVKANPDPMLLRVIAPHVDGFEVSSGGEFAHVRSVLPKARMAFGGPGKTDAELDLSPYRLHVESPGELRRLLQRSQPVDVLLRANLDVPLGGAALAMGGGATPFGMDPTGIEECLRLISGPVRFRGLHAHLASGLDAPDLLKLATAIIGYARQIGATEINLGGGMAVDYQDPERRFDWLEYGRGLAGYPEKLRIEPGRAMTAYCGWYLTKVLDIKRVHGELFAILTGGTHHLRTPVTKGHNQPFIVFSSSDHLEEQSTNAGYSDRLGRMSAGSFEHPEERAITASSSNPPERGATTADSFERPEERAITAGSSNPPERGATTAGFFNQPEMSATGGSLRGPEETVTLVGQLCTPKDVFARRVRVSLEVGDVVAFGMAGAYAWNISHHDFLMHPKPDFHYISGIS
ncbi:hypothetical protein Aple_093220 [Acrocarpospora pleiomorpha]|uniref:Diaminopimelate decarboxylase n=1 Tax=Acrocarpospora pleiomorpha TaxID=90975 RepID=A0A5M3Y3A2_9ACTN|nr:hypothetical protein [Acrocarpospora pleiomorpha]GES26423.1 hypothetical protein Aple_093220 [Acrocarpospora pleiomorpha]